MEPPNNNNNSEKNKKGLPPIVPTPGAKRARKSTATTPPTGAVIATGTGTANTTATAPSDALDSQISPPGMRLRSGRKKKPTPKRRFEEIESDDDGDDNNKKNDANADGTDITLFTGGDDDDVSKRVIKKARRGKTAEEEKEETAAVVVAEEVEEQIGENQNEKMTEKETLMSKDGHGGSHDVIMDNQDQGVSATTADNNADDKADANADDKADATMFHSPPTTTRIATAVMGADVDMDNMDMNNNNQASGPSITNVNLSLPINNEIDTATTTTTTQPPPGNTRVRNFFTPAPKKSGRPIFSMDAEVDADADVDVDDNMNLLVTATHVNTSPVRFKDEIENIEIIDTNTNTNTNTSSDEFEIEKTLVDNINQNIRDNAGSTNTIPPTPEGRENGLFHYYFKRAIDRLTPIPVQFNSTTQNNVEDMVRPFPIRSTNGVHLDTLHTNQEGDENANANVIDNVVVDVNGHAKIDGQQEEEEGDDFSNDEDFDLNETSSTSSSSSSLFHKTYVWIILIHVICVLLGGLSSMTSMSSIHDIGSISSIVRSMTDNTKSNGASIDTDAIKSDVAKFLSKSFMVIPNVAKYQYDNLYQFEKYAVRNVSKEGELVGADNDATAQEVEVEEVVEIIEEVEEEEEEEEEVELEPIIQIEEVIVEEIVLIDNVELEEKERTLLHQRKMIADYKEEQKQKQEYIDHQEEKLKLAVSKLENQWEAYKRGESGAEDLKNQLVSAGNSLDSSMQSITHTSSVLNGSKKLMKDLLVEDQNNTKWHSVLEEFSSSMKTLYQSSILDLAIEDLELFSFGSSISIPGEGCKGMRNVMEKPSVIKKMKKEEKKMKKKKKISYASQKDLINASNYLMREAEAYVVHISKSSKLSKVAIAWFMDTIQGEIDLWNVELPNVEDINIASTDNLLDNVEAPGISLEDVQTIIDGLLEVEMADTTGEYDYASIGNGAKVIRAGIRKTSPSLVDNLPFINKFLSKTSLKFYGHGAEAALLPTFPKTALGQCWSFEEEGTRKQLAIKEMIDEAETESMEMDPDRGEYATLSVSLPKPIHVQSVVIEHPSKLISSTSQESAVRNFRIVGYMDKEATGNPWLLGSFEYKSEGAEGALQEFKVKSVDESGMPIPKLSSVSLAIDSNWGGDYTCLYRFRVQGN